MCRCPTRRWGWGGGRTCLRGLQSGDHDDDDCHDGDDDDDDDGGDDHDDMMQ